MIYDFGSCELDTARRQLSCRGEPVHIEPQVFDLLCYLVERRDRAVTKDEIFANIWGGRAVSDAVLTTRIRSLRKLIDGEDDAQSKIATLHRVGYRFRAPVTERSDETRPAAANSSPPAVEQAAPELRQVTVIALQPRLDLGSHFDPDHMDVPGARMRAAIADHLEPEFDAIVESADGTVYAVIGTKRSRETDAARAAGIALQVRDWAAGGGVSLAVGLAEGTIAQRGEQIRGDALLRAAQAVAQASARQAVITPELASLLGDAARCRKRGHGLLLEEVLREAPPSRSHPPFVGRIVELGLVERAMEATVGKHSGGCITFEGAAGVGKSRMVARAMEMIRRRGGHFSLVYMREIPNDGALHNSLLRGLAPVLDGIDTVIDKMPPQLRRTIRRLLDDTAADSAQDPLAHGPALSAAIIDILRLASKEAPLLIAIEDAHWIDPESEKLVLDLAGIYAGMQAILLVTGRPSARALFDEIAARAKGDIVVVTLGPLSDAQSHELLAGMAGDLDNGTIERLVARAEGNPLFLTRLAETARRQGADALDHVPSSIQSVVQAQFDQLPDDLRDNLRKLSVLGERVERKVAELVYGHELVADSLIEGFLRASGAWLQFSHNLVRECIYLSQPASERKRLHTRAAQALVDHDPLLAAEHAVRGDLSIAPEICLRVARDTFHFRRHGRSIELIEHATQLPSTPDQRALMHIFLGSAKADLGKEDEAMRHYSASASLAESSVAAVFACVRIARLNCRHYRLEEAATALEPTKDWLKRDPGPGYLASEVEDMRSIIARLGRDTASAIRHAEAALEISDHPHSTARAMVSLASASLEAGLLRSAHDHAEACRALVAEQSLGLVEPDILPVALRACWYAEPAATRLDEAHEAIDRAEWIGLPRLLMQAWLVRLEIALECDDMETALHDAGMLRSAISENDIAERERFLFLDALCGLTCGDETGLDAVSAYFEGPVSGSFSPLRDLLAALRPGASPATGSRHTPFEELWRQRVRGEQSVLVAPEESRLWRTFAERSPLARILRKQPA